MNWLLADCFRHLNRKQFLEAFFFQDILFVSFLKSDNTTFSNTYCSIQLFQESVQLTERIKKKEI